MSRVGFFAILLCVGVAAISDIPERVDENGVTWVGPIRKCVLGSSDSEIDKCVAQITEDLTPKIAEGLPEIDVVPLNPFFMKKLDYVLKAGPLDINVAVKNLKFDGFTNYNKLTFKTETQEGQTLMHFEYELPTLGIDVTYKAGGSAVLFPIQGSGPAHIDVSNIKAKGIMVSKKAVREDGTPIVQLETIKLSHLSLGGFTFRARGLFPGNPIINTAVHYIANQYSRQLFAFIKPEVERHVEENLVDIINPALKYLTYIPPFLL